MSGCETVLHQPAALLLRLGGWDTRRGNDRLGSCGAADQTEKEEEEGGTV